MRNNDYTLESVDNALQIILMLQSQGSVQLSQVARELGVARSTAHRLLGTMVGRGFAVQDERRRYLPGPAIASSSAVTTTANLARLRILARSHLRELCRRSGETAHLMVREGKHVRFLDSVEGAQALRIGSRVGVTLPALVTSGGKALLAELKHEDIDQIYGTGVDAPEKPHLRRLLAAVRQRGYGTNIGESERGVTAIGVRVRSPDNSSIVAMTVSAPTIRLPRGRIPNLAETVIEVAHGLDADIASDAGMRYSNDEPHQWERMGPTAQA